MQISRREFIECGAAACLATGFLAACASQPSKDSGSASASRPDGSAPIGFDAYLEQRGYTPAPSAPLITGHAFNGGLRYDDETSLCTPKTYVKQQVARVEDVAKQSMPGTLPYFTIISLDTSTPDLARTASDLVLAYLTGVVGLDPTRLRVTTTEKSSASFALLEKYGIKRGQVRVRAWDEAKRDGAGSGCFAPAGHPASPNAPSFSLEYVMPDGRELEIAEISHSDGNGRSSGGIGVERVEMARTGRCPAWESRLDALSRALQEESGRTGVGLPPGAAVIIGTSAR